MAEKEKQKGQPNLFSLTSMSDPAGAGEGIGKKGKHVQKTRENQHRKKEHFEVKDLTITVVTSDKS